MGKPRVSIGADHRGFELKQHLVSALSDWGYQIHDAGVFSNRRTDFPVVAFAVSQDVAKQRGKSVGVLLCGSGTGMVIAANKVKGIRAALVLNPYMAKQAVEHDQANVLVLPALLIKPAQAKRLLKTFLTSTPAADPAYTRRVQQISKFERTH